MDDTKEGFVLIGTTMIIMVIFLISVLAVLVIYRRRKLQHVQEIKGMNEKFARELLQAQMEVQRQTMQHIGREIHDNVGQKLTLAVLYVQQLESKEDKVGAVADIIHESLADLRSLSKDLTNVNYMASGLYQLIQHECSKIQATRHCKAAVYGESPGPDLPEASKSFILRIIQECMQNSLKHSHCSEIAVFLQRDEGGIRIKTTDNGKGFNAKDETILHQGIGIANMKKRAEMIGGAVTIESIPGKGTKVTLFIPSQKLNT